MRDSSKELGHATFGDKPPQILIYLDKTFEELGPGISLFRGKPCRLDLLYRALWTYYS